MEQDLDSFRLAQRQKTIEYNMRNGVGAVMGATHVNKQDASRGIVFDLDGSRAAAERSSEDHVHIRRLLNATSGIQEVKPKYRAHHAPGNINSVVRDLALNNKAASRGTKMGTGIQPEIQASTGINYELTIAKPASSGLQASSRYGGTGINAAVRNRAVTGGGSHGFGDFNIIRDELNKEDTVLHPQRTLEEHRALTNAETQNFKNRQWSPLR